MQPSLALLALALLQLLPPPARSQSPEPEPPPPPPPPPDPWCATTQAAHSLSFPPSRPRPNARNETLRGRCSQRGCGLRARPVRPRQLQLQRRLPCHAGWGQLRPGQLRGARDRAHQRRRRWWHHHLVRGILPFVALPTFFLGDWPACVVGVLVARNTETHASQKQLREHRRHMRLHLRPGVHR
jgi:hypothetical protein